jgi:rhamnogalacturonan acetylesterase
MKIPVLGLCGLLLALPPLAWSQPAATPAPRPTLYICGDSTAAPMGRIVMGWGERIGDFLDAARIRVENRAVGGRSARTFITEGRWQAVRSQLHRGDVVLLQFGHNDTKSAINTTRYDLAGLGEESEAIANPRGGDPLVIRTFGH